jgi:hypothetical protein
MKKLFARLSLSFILAFLVVPFFASSHSLAFDPPVQEVHPTVSMSLLNDVVTPNVYGNINVVVYNSISGSFPAGDYTYKIFITGNAATSEPSGPLTPPTWYLKNGGSGQSFSISDEQAAAPLSDYSLAEFSWPVDMNTAFGDHYIKTVIYDSSGTPFYDVSTTGKVTIVSENVSVGISVNDVPPEYASTYMLVYYMDIPRGPITIATTMTATDASMTYTGVLYITGIGYANTKNHSADSPDPFYQETIYSYSHVSTPQINTYEWKNPSLNQSAVGIHQVLFKVYNQDGSVMGSTSTWIKLCNGLNCGTTGTTTGTTGVTTPPSGGDTSTLNLGGALGVVGINVDFTNYESVKNFLIQKWFPTIVGMFAFLGVIYSGWLYIMSAGDQAKADKGKKGLVYSIIGIAIAVGANVIINVSNSVINTYNNSTSIYGGGDSLFTKATNMIAMISGMLAFLYLIYSGILYLTASGEPDNAKKGLQGVINAAIGIVIVVAAWAIIGAVTGTLGAYFK